jgi:type IV secretory pathway VirJ component
VKTKKEWHRATVTLVVLVSLAAGGPVVPQQAEAQAGDTISGPNDLPLSEIPAAQGPLLAVLITGDGGWVSADQSLATALAQRNVAVVGLNAPRYLSRRPSPAQAGNDLTRIVRYFLTGWHREQVIVIGYSRGADIGPFMVSRLPADLRERIALTVLLGPGKSASFSFGLLDVLRNHEGNAEYPVTPEVAKLRGIPVLCISGSKDSGSICPALGQSGLARSVVRRGGHRITGDQGPALADLILAGHPTPSEHGGGTK